jgi:hypothetical protein
VGRTGPLAIHDFMEVVGIRDVGKLHLLLVTRLPRQPGRRHSA